MIQTGTRLRVADNSGAKEIECFRILGRSRSTIAGVGDVIVAAVKQATTNAG
ncbi:MAG: uL14 family ribosomal protein, partial [Candidatus Limnocylindrus sp.]